MGNFFRRLGDRFRNFMIGRYGRGADRAKAAGFTKLKRLGKGEYERQY